MKEIRELTGLSQTAFGNRYHIPKRTIQNWENGVNKCPVYLKELLEFRVKCDLKSANPDEDADNHYDGDIIKRWK